MSARRSPRIVVSIVNWNTPDLTLACLRALAASDYVPHRIVVVDNASRDDSVARIRADWPDVTVIESAENLGFAAGHELALSVAREVAADAVWLLNSDACVEATTLPRLVDAYLEFGDALYGAVPLHRRGDGIVILDFSAKFLPETAQPQACLRDSDIVFDALWETRGPLHVGAVPGSSLLIPLAVVASHGWLDPAWFMYCEEIDYCYRLRAAGVPRFLVPAARVWHTQGGSSAGRPGVAEVMQYYRTRNEILLARRHARRGIAVVITLKKVARALWEWPRAHTRGRRILLGAWHGWREVSGRTMLPDMWL